MTKEREICGVKVIVSGQTYNKYIGTLQEQLEEKDKEIERLTNIIDELEKWLEEKQAFYGINQQGFSWGVCGEALDKLKELKEGKQCMI